MHYILLDENIKYHAPSHTLHFNNKIEDEIDSSSDERNVNFELDIKHSFNILVIYFEL